MMTSFVSGIFGSNSAEVSYLANDLSFYLFIALYELIYTSNPGANSNLPLYLATGLVSLFLNFL